METLGGFQKTGRVTRGPASDLVELLDEHGFPHTAIAFHAQYREHPAIGPALEVVKGFLEAPYVTGMVELVEHLPDEGAFVYPTGESWSVHEVIRKLADLGQTAGVRAGLELMYAAGQVLIEAAESGEAHAVYSHGGLTPWRVLIKADGQVQIIGHAVPQVEILQFHQDPDEIPKEDAFRYCPPERMEAEDEDLTSDLFSLALIAFELMTGRPVYDGLVNDIRTQAARGEGSRRLFRFKKHLPAPALDLLRTCLKPDPEHRYGDGDDFLEAVQRVLASPEAEGASLMEVMDRVGGMQRPPGEGLEAGATVALDKDALRKMAADLETGDAPPAEEKPARETFKPAARRPRRSRRTKAQAASPEELPGPAPIAEDPSPSDSDDRWKKPARGRRGRRGASEPAESAPADAAGGEATKRAGRSASRLKRSGADEILAKLKSSSDSPARRRERGGGGDAAKLISNILSSSEDSRRPARGSRPEPKPDPEEELRASQARSRPRRGRRVTRRRGGEDSVPPEPPAKARRSSPTQERQPVEEESAEAAPAPKARARRVRRAEPEPEPKPAPEPSPEPKPKAKARRVPEEEPAPKAAVAKAKPKSKPKLKPAGPAPSAPRRLKATGGASVPLKLRIGPDGDTFKTRFPGKATLAECVARLTASLLPIQTDLSGRLTSGWRLGPESGPLSGATLVETQASDTLLLLHPIAAAQVIAEIQVEDADAPHRFRAPVTNVAPAASLVDHLVRWLGLEGGPWTLHAGDRALGPYELIDEVDLSTTPLVLRK